MQMANEKLATSEQPSETNKVFITMLGFFIKRCRRRNNTKQNLRTPMGRQMKNTENTRAGQRALVVVWPLVLRAVKWRCTPRQQRARTLRHLALEPCSNRRRAILSAQHQPSTSAILAARCANRAWRQPIAGCEAGRWQRTASLHGGERPAPGGRADRRSSWRLQRGDCCRMQWTRPQTLSSYRGAAPHEWGTAKVRTLASVCKRLLRCLRERDRRELPTVLLLPPGVQRLLQQDEGPRLKSVVQLWVDVAPHIHCAARAPDRWLRGS